MTYDPKTKTIYTGPGNDLMADAGIHFIETLRSLAMQGGPSSITADWFIIEKWLECSGRELTKVDHHDIRKAWRAFLAMGVAPTPKLQESINVIAREYQGAGRDYRRDLPPQDVIGVFARLLGAPDLSPGPMPHQVPTTSSAEKASEQAQPSESNRVMKRWIFVCGAWLVLAFWFIQIFHPFRDLTYRDAELRQSLAFMSVPIVAWILVAIYKRFVR